MKRTTPLISYLLAGLVLPGLGSALRPRKLLDTADVTG
jgi:hypothetical protein